MTKVKNLSEYTFNSTNIQQTDTDLQTRYLNMVEPIESYNTRLNPFKKNL